MKYPKAYYARLGIFITVITVFAGFAVSIIYNAIDESRRELGIAIMVAIVFAYVSFQFIRMMRKYMKTVREVTEWLGDAQIALDAEDLYLGIWNLVRKYPNSYRAIIDKMIEFVENENVIQHCRRVH